jgi:hypothetical protein
VGSHIGGIETVDVSITAAPICIGRIIMLTSFNRPIFRTGALNTLICALINHKLLADTELSPRGYRLLEMVFIFRLFVHKFIACFISQ